jgi:hypothetical protein
MIGLAEMKVYAHGVSKIAINCACRLKKLKNRTVTSMADAGCIAKAPACP